MDYGTAYNALAPVYDPQVQNVQTQIDALQPQQDAQQASLDQAKVNAFKDITNSANSKGMLFSGFTPDQQATYIGTKYLPAVANLKTSFNNTKNTLLGQINTIQSQRAKDALGTVSDYQKTQADNAYKQANLDLGYARLNSSNANSAANRAAANNKPLTATETVGAIHDFLQANKGGDNHVAPAVLASAYKTYLSAGGTDANFWKNYQGYWNDKQSNYKAMFNAAKAAK